MSMGGPVVIGRVLPSRETQRGNECEFAVGRGTVVLHGSLYDRQRDAVVARRGLHCMFPILDTARPVRTRQWIVMSREQAALLYVAVYPGRSLSFEGICKKVLSLPIIRKNITFWMSRPQFFMTLQKVPYCRPMSLLPHFRLPAVISLQEGLEKHWSRWERAEGWSKCGTISYCRIPKDEEFSRPLIVCKIDGVVKHVFLELSCKRDGACIAQGGRNKVSLVLELMDGTYCVRRRCLEPERGGRITSAFNECALVDQLPGDAVLSTLVHGTYRKRSGVMQFFSIHPLFYGDFGRCRPGSRDRAVEIGLALMEKLAGVHERGVVHRDLKPDSVLTSADGQTIRISDWERACGIEADYAPSGTPEFMYFFGRGTPSNLLNDLWGVGLILWRILGVTMHLQDGTTRSYAEFVREAHELRERFFCETQLTYETYFEAMRERFDGKWFVQPTDPHSLESVIWRALNPDLPFLNVRSFLRSFLIPLLSEVPL